MPRVNSGTARPMYCVQKKAITSIIPETLRIGGCLGHSVMKERDKRENKLMPL